MKTIHIGADAA
jgi:hypothetical protein